jgi:hypothetical protein
VWVEAALYHPSREQHGRDLVRGPIRPHEPEPFDGNEVVSLANQAAALRKLFFSLEHAILAAEFLQLGTLLGGQAVLPSSASACSTHFWVDTADGSNSLAKLSGVRLARTSSTLGRRRAQQQILLGIENRYEHHHGS